MKFRLVSYDPMGSARGVLPDALEIKPVVSLSDAATLQVQYPTAGVNADHLADRMAEIGLEYYDPDSDDWVEPPSCRFISMKGTDDFLDETPTVAVDMVHVGDFMLSHATVWSTDGLHVDADGKAQFLSATAGEILVPLLQRAQARGWGDGIDWDFSTSQDSSGAGFEHILTIAYDPETDLNTILANLRDQQVIDYRWQGRTLQLFNPHTVMARETGVQLVASDGHQSAPEEWSNEDLRSHVRVLGEDGRSWEFSNPLTTALGRLESVVTQGGVSDPGTAALLSRESLLAGEATRVSRTREFDVTGGSPAPFRDYVPGDWVLILGDGGDWEQLRVHSVSVTVNDEGVSGHATLGDRLDDLLSRIAKQTKGITGGATVGGSGVRPSPEGPDTRKPQAPVGLVGESDFYFDDHGFPRGVVWFSWAEVQLATNGTGITVDEYSVEVSEDYVGSPAILWGTVSGAFYSYSPLDIHDDGGVPKRYKARVRARAESGVLGPWSDYVAVEMVEDVVPPPPPLLQPGDISTTLGTVRVDITGLDEDGNPQPGDFSHFMLYESGAPDGDFVLVASRSGQESGYVWQSGNRPAGLEVFLRMTAVDVTGNESAPSAVQSVVPGRLVDESSIEQELEDARDRLEQAQEDFREGNDQRKEEIERLKNVVIPALEESLNEGLSDEVTRLEGLIESAGGSTIMRGADEPVDASNYDDGTYYFQYDTLGADGKLQAMWVVSDGAWIKGDLDETILPLAHIEQGTYGELSGGRLVAGSIETSALAVNDWENLIVDSDLRELAEAEYVDTGAEQGYPGALFELESSQWNLLGQGLLEQPWGAEVTESGITYLTANLPEAGEEEFLYSSLTFNKGGVGIPAFEGEQFIFSLDGEGDLKGLLVRAVGRDEDASTTFARSLIDGDVGNRQDIEFTIPANQPGRSQEPTRSIELQFTTSSAGGAYGSGRWRITQFRRKTPGVLIEDGAVKAKNIDVKEVFTNKTITETLWADSIHALTAELTRATISTPNLIPNTTDEDAAAWYGARINSDPVPSVFFPGEQTGEDPHDTTGTVRLDAGEKYKLSLDAAGTQRSTHFAFELLPVNGGDGVHIPTIDGVKYSWIAGTISDWSSHEHQFTVPVTGDYRLRIFPNMESGATNTGGYQWLRNPRIENMMDGRLIVDGSVDTRHLNVTESMMAALLQAKKIEAGDIQANAVTADKLRAGAVEAEHIQGNAIDGKTITGALIQTQAHSNRGVKQTDDGIIAFDSSGEQTVNIDGTDNYMHGRFYTNGPGEPGILLEPARSNQGPGVWFSEDGSASVNWAAIWTSVNSNGYFHTLNIRPRKGSGGPGVVKLHGTTNAKHIHSDSFSTGGGISVDKSSFLQGDVYLNGVSGITEVSGRLNTYGPNYFYNLPTTSGWNQLRISSNSGLVYFYSSSRRIKINAEPLHEVDPYQVLTLNPKIWYDRTDIREQLEEIGLAEEDFVFDTEDGPVMDTSTVEGLLGENMPRRVAGLIAEEVEDAGLAAFAEYSWDSERDESVLQGVAYDRMWTLLIPIIRDQQEKLANQGQSIAALEQRLDRLDDQNQ
ncbi:MAG: hypothetical protein HLX51_02070 [Micrococcaceae bacterium]|nr:hypothetical protein [Micrococcaceae bacterium]